MKHLRKFESSGYDDLSKKLESFKHEVISRIKSELKRIERIYLRGYDPEEFTYVDDPDISFDGFVEFDKLQFMDYADTGRDYMLVTCHYFAISVDGNHILISDHTSTCNGDTKLLLEVEIEQMLYILNSLEAKVSYMQIELIDGE